MIETLELKNFKSHRNTKLVFDDSRLHAIVGQNSSGKTSILQALHYLCRLADSSFANIFQDERSPEFIITSGQDNMSVIGSGFWGYNPRTNWQASYRWKQGRNPPWFPIASWKIDRDNEVDVEGWEGSLNKADKVIITSLKYTVHLKLVATHLAKASYSEAIIPRVEFDGSGLAPTLEDV